MPESEWAPGPADLPPHMGKAVTGVDICPGWLVRLDTVSEACQAYAAFEKGALALHDPLGLAPVYEAVMVFHRAMNLYQNERQQKLAKKI